jgi:hypothetical protein
MIDRSSGSSLSIDDDRRANDMMMVFRNLDLGKKWDRIRWTWAKMGPVFKKIAAAAKWQRLQRPQSSRCGGRDVEP